jgi:hypothetical protein
VPVNQQDQTLQEIRGAFRLYCGGEQAEGRRLLQEIWDKLGADGDVFHRCVAAHYLADVQEDPQDELKWDRTALEVADSLVSERAGTYPSAAAVRAFYPSLHLNLADDYRKLGDFDNARRHADRGMELSGSLGLDAYGQSVRAGLVRVDSQIGERDSGPSVVFDFD